MNRGSSTNSTRYSALPLTNPKKFDNANVRGYMRVACGVPGCSWRRSRHPLRKCHLVQTTLPWHGHANQSAGGGAKAPGAMRLDTSYI